MKNLALFFAVVFTSALTWGAPKYAGQFVINQGGPHKAISGEMTLNFEGDQLTQVAIKTSAPVMGKTDFVSSEQALFSNTAGSPPQMAVIYKLQGAPHKWFYTVVVSTQDQGKSYTGTIYKGTGTVDDIKKALDNQTVGNYKTVGTASLSQL